MILSQFIFPLASVLLTGAFSAPLDTSNCAVDKESCSCPSDTTFYECTTTAVIGAALEDVQALTGDCKSNLKYFHKFHVSLTNSQI